MDEQITAPNVEERIATVELQLKSLIAALGINMIIHPNGVQIQVPPKGPNLGLLAKLAHSVSDLQQKINGGPLIISPN